MNINRNNYEEFLLLYMDAELSATERRAVEEFLNENPDLKEEFELLMQTRLKPEEEIRFGNKDLLFRQESSKGGSISLSNYETCFISYIDDELNEEERKEVEFFLTLNPGVLQEFELLGRTKLDPRETIVFSAKDSLYRTEKAPIRIVSIIWWRVAAAASVILIAGLFWIYSSQTGDSGNHTQTIAGTHGVASSKINPKPVEGEINNNPQTPENIGRKAVADSDPKQGKDLSRDQATHKQPQKKTLKPEIDAVPETDSRNKPAPDYLIAKAPTSIETVTSIDPQPDKEPGKPVVASIVKPNIIDKASFAQDNNNNTSANEAVYKDDQGVTYLDTDNSDKKTKGKFRGLFRKAARFVDRVTNPEIDDNKSIVRVASFEIGKNK